MGSLSTISHNYKLYLLDLFNREISYDDDNPLLPSWDQK